MDKHIEPALQSPKVAILRTDPVRSPRSGLKRILLILTLTALAALSVATYRRYQVVSQFRSIDEFERMLVGNSIPKLSKDQIIIKFGDPDIVHDAGSEEVLVYPANDGIRTFLFFPTRVKFVCRKSDGVLRTFQLRSD